MGRGRNKNARVLKRDFKQPRKDTWAVEKRVPKADGSGYESTAQENQDFELYYKYQGIVPENEWEQFMKALRTPLPTTFRINGTGRFAAALRDKLESDFFSKLQMAPTEIEGEALVPPKPLAWYPNKLAWQLRYSRTQIRKLDALSEIHELLKRENSSGGITRQEAVSMAPPLFLDLKPEHKILDTCAAPGSKTAQMLEMLHEDSELPHGFVVANDVDAQRCNLLVHQTKRMQSPALLVTNHDASGFPLICKPGIPKSEALYFDRILCDVPCSGDGTLRKAPDLWRRWTSSMGTGLHPLQVRITLHTASLLKVGGRMVYSTCSFNPLEDEAVVAEVLRQSKGSLELVDVSEKLPEFRRQNGLKSWSVRSNKGTWFTNLHDANEAKHAQNLSESMFADDESASLPLDRCMRVLPHHDDTGGFFIAVFQKKAHLPQLQAQRWKRMKERWQEAKNAQRSQANGTGPQQNPTQLSNPNLHPNPNPEDKPQNPVDASIGSKKSPPAAQKPGSRPQTQAKNNEPKKGEKTENEEEGKNQFGPGMAEGADEAADAAVGFADAVIEQDPDEAMVAAEDAADAVEHVADIAEDNEEREASQISVGDVPVPKTAHRQEGEGFSDEVQKPEETELKDADTNNSKAEAQPKGNKKTRQKKVKPGDEPLVLFNDKGILDGLEQFFGLASSFPLRTQLVTRTGLEDQTATRKIYIVSSGIREAIIADGSRALKVSSAGLKVFDKNDKKNPHATGAAYRISQDGLPVILPHITKQILRPTATEMLRILKERYVVVPYSQRLKEAEEEAKPSDEPPSKKQKPEPPQSENNGEDRNGEGQEGKEIEPKGEAKKIPLCDLETIRQLEDIRAGCAICILRDEEARQLGLSHASGDSGSGPMAIVCWRGKTSLSILVDKNTSQVLAEALERAIQNYAASHAPPG